MPPEDLTSIDVSQLDSLAKLEADHRAIQSLSNKAAWRRDKEMEIYTRVVADYEARMAAISEEASPIRQRVRDDLQKLEALFRQAEQALDRAKVKLQECEFRHEIGELTVEQFKECQQAAERTVAQQEVEFESVKTLRARYLEVVPAEPVAPPPPPPPPAPPAPARATKKAPPATAPVAAAPPAAPPEPAAVPPPPPVPVAPPPAPPAASAGDATPVPKEPAAASDSSTMFLRPPSTGDFKVPESQGKDTRSFHTVAVTAAMLIEDRAGVPGKHHPLGITTTIGRTQDNQIVVAIKEVSRRHAQVLRTEAGYVLKDLGSPNGTFVNGQRITEQRLQEGDRVEMGGKVFIFAGPS